MRASDTRVVADPLTPRALPSSTQSGGLPISFSGDIGDGPKTAYDALPPKPWKPEEAKS